MDRELEVLQQVFGLTEFRAHQREIIHAWLEGHDALVVMPTGSGKSLCYQLPALMRDGLTIVVSPLIALMQNQVEALQERGIAAAYWNSSVVAGERMMLAEAMDTDKLKLLYVAPETLMRPSFLQWLKTLNISGFAIDEAHCVTQWGPDFRPEYLALQALKTEFAHVPVMALTASADAHTQRDISDRLLKSPRAFITGFARDNLFLEVVEKKGAKQQLLNFIEQRHPQQAGIVYVNSRERSERIAQWLQDHGIDAWTYHAGMSPQARQAAVNAFRTRAHPVMVATIAFGMGMDRADVRFVAHLDMPKRLEHYYQEIGRAGRDGLPATAWMTVGLRDYLTGSFFSQVQDSAAMRAASAEHLQAMFAYSQTLTCRTQQLLHAFGEDSPACGHCDNCCGEPTLKDVTHEAQLILSAVYRQYKHSGFCFGVEHTLNVVRGVRHDKVLQYGHETLSVFGKGSQYTVTQLRRVVRRLLAIGALRVVATVEGLYLGDKAKEVLVGQCQVLDKAYG